VAFSVTLLNLRVLATDVMREKLVKQPIFQHSIKLPYDLPFQ
jgi:hypothetical protein